MKIISRLMIFALMTIFLVMGATAQTNNVLVPDVPTTGQIAQGDTAQIFTFATGAGSTATVSIASDTGFALTMILSDANGIVLGQVQKPAGAANGVPSLIENVPLANAGTYYVTVLITPGVVTALSGQFVVILTLSGGEATIPPVQTTPEVESTAEVTIAPTPDLQLPPTNTTNTVVDASTFALTQVSLASGINVSLTWNTQDDLNLQVRAPNGGTLFWDSRSTDDSGVFGADVNGLCEVLTPPPATETATWQGGALSAGRYEVLVYYRQSCSTTPSPVEFTLNVDVNGTPLAPVTGSLQPPVNNNATVYISSFVVNSDATATISTGGLYTDTRVLPLGVSEILTAPSIPLFFNTPTEGVIVGDQYYQVYTFSGEAGQLVNISMTKSVGNLDTLLLLFDNTGNIIADNDDVNSPADTNSAMSVRLPSSGTYTVFASRYGKDVGGTEGTYNLLVAEEAPERAVNLNLPTGDIEVTLTWNTRADLQLLVRDPFGDSVYDDAESVRSGGLLTATGNRNCSTTLATTPAYHIYWPSGTKDVGAYEVEVWYQSECGDTTPVNYSLYIVVGGELIFTEASLIRFNERYVTSFNINLDGTATPSLGGIIGGSETLPYQAELESAIVMLGGNSFTGSITPDNKFDVYAFDGLVGDVVTVTMTASSPTLDTLLFMIDPNQVEIARNDDANADTRNSAINRVTLAANGRYYILATHFGAIYGGTTGAYTLSLQVERPISPTATPQP